MLRLGLSTANLSEYQRWSWAALRAQPFGLHLLVGPIGASTSSLRSYNCTAFCRDQSQSLPINISVIRMMMGAGGQGAGDDVAPKPGLSVIRGARS